MELEEASDSHIISVLNDCACQGMKSHLPNADKAPFLLKWHKRNRYGRNLIIKAFLHKMYVASSQ